MAFKGRIGASFVGKTGESINHLLDLCPFTNNIWEKGEEIFKKR